MLLAIVWIAGSVQLFAGYAAVEKGKKAVESLKLDKALEYYQQAARFDSNYWLAYMGRAMCIACVLSGLGMLRMQIR